MRYLQKREDRASKAIYTYYVLRICFTVPFSHSRDSSGEYTARKEEKGKDLLFSLPVVILKWLPKFLAYIPFNQREETWVSSTDL